MKLTTVLKTLSDSSEVFDVVLSDERGGSVTFHAFSESAAEELMRDLKSAVHAYTCDVADVTFGEAA